MPPPNLPPPVPAGPSSRSEIGPILIAVAVILIALLLLAIALLIPRGAGSGATSGTGSSELPAESVESPSNEPVPATESTNDSIALDDAAESDSEESAQRSEDEASCPSKSTAPAGLRDQKSGIGDSFEELPPTEPSPVVPGATIPPFSGSGASFFGIRQHGHSFAFVLDYSSSMGQSDVIEAGSRYSLACDELLRCLKRMDRKHRVSLLLFNDLADVPSQFQDCAVSPKNQADIRQYLDTKVPSGGTDPTDAVLTAINEEVDAIFLVSDGEFDNSMILAAMQSTQARTPIHSISIGYESETLRQLSLQSGGQYRSVR